MRVLILDDEDIKARLVEAWFNTQKIECDVIRNKSDFLKVADTKYDYFLIDYCLEGNTTGEEIARIYQEKHPESNIVVYSGFEGALKSIKEFKTIDFDKLQDYIESSFKAKTQQQPAYQIYEIKELQKDIANTTKRIETLFDIYEKQEGKIEAIDNKVSQHEVLLSVTKESTQRMEKKVDSLMDGIVESDKSMMSKFNGVTAIIISLITLGFGLITWFISHLMSTMMNVIGK